MSVKPLIAAIVSLSCAGFIAQGAQAEDYSKNSKAKEWNLYGEQKALFSGKVVDILCELTGDCPANCGDGNRHMGIVRADDNRLIAVLKNRQASFNGATEDLLPYCNKNVDVDGLMVGEDEVVETQFYMVQLIRETGAAKWNKTTRWTKRWRAKNPEAKGKGAWFRRDPRVKKQLARTGHFGLGLEFDQKYLEENE
mgnify:CR=1 FL=1